MGKRNPDKDPAVVEAERKFYGCPGGHRLPHHTEKGDCTPLWCAAGLKPGKRKAVAPKPVGEGRRSAPSGRPADGAAEGGLTDVALVAGRTSRASARDGEAVVEETARAEEATRVARGRGRFAARMAVADVPAGMEGTAAEDWADKRLLSLLPLAVAEVEAQLKFGDASQRERAADKVMAATGRGKREAGNNSAPTIIFMTQGEGGSGRVAVPWSQNKSRTASMVEVEVAPPLSLPSGGSQGAEVGLKPSKEPTAKPVGSTDT